MKKLLLILAVPVLLIACNKDKFQTKPQISIKSYNTTVLPAGADMIVNFTFTDKEGDLGGGKFIYYAKRLNVRPYMTGYPDSVVVGISPDIPNKTDKGDLELTLHWQDLHRSDIENDTIQIKFQVADRANHYSDTTVSDKLVILKN